MVELNSCTFELADHWFSHNGYDTFVAGCILALPLVLWWHLDWL